MQRLTLTLTEPEAEEIQFHLAGVIKTLQREHAAGRARYGLLHNDAPILERINALENLSLAIAAVSVRVSPPVQLELVPEPIFTLTPKESAP
jgi:hypothetical protein